MPSSTAVRARAPSRAPTRRLATTRARTIATRARADARGDASVRVMTFNVLCPEYKRAGTKENDDARESANVEDALRRNEKILDLICDASPDVLCVQEFWHANEAMRELWTRRLREASYDAAVTPRTSGRCDGLLTAVKRDRLEVKDARDVLFNDCGDRVAHVARVASKANGRETLVVNTHLLFPHNENSSLIRLREVFKILEFLRELQREPAIGGKKLPIVITGDFNGSSSGRVYRFLTSQGFTNALDACQGREGCATSWVSHLNHHGECVGVDHMFLLNPSKQVLEIGASWKEAVFAMMRAKIVQQGIVDDVAAFKEFDANSDGSLTKDEFIEFANKIGLCGEKSPGLLTAELEALYEACDKDGNGEIDFQEFVQRMDIKGMADLTSDPNLSLDIGDFMASSAADQVVVSQSWDDNVFGEGDFQIECATLPTSMLEGRWPTSEEFDLSDHGPLWADFTPR